MSRFGIFQQSAQMESASGSELTIEDDIAADAAYDEIVELAQEAEMEAIVIDQAVAISGELDGQSEMISGLVANPSMVTAGTVAVAQDALTLAVVALGGSGKTGFEVTGESMSSSPIESLEVTGEGVVDTIKKIYAGIKMAFQRIVLTIKKLASKVVVAMNGTGKKAEKLLKSFTADKTAIAKESKIEPAKALKILESSDAIEALYSGEGKVFGVDAAKLVSNMRSMSKFIEEVTTDIANLNTLFTAKKALKVNADGAEDDSDGNKLATDAQAMSLALAGLTAASDKYKLVQKISAGDAAAINSMSFELAAGEAAANIDDAKFSDAGVDDTTGKPSFYPMYVKGRDVYGVAFYVEKLEASDSESVTGVASKIKYKAIHIPLSTDDEINTKSDNMKVLGKTDIEKALGALKPASKQLKSFADARMKDIDKVMKEVDAVAKKATGMTMFNRLSNSEFNKIRLFMASTYISAIFAEVKGTRARLANIQQHIAMYSTTAV